MKKRFGIALAAAAFTMVGGAGVASAQDAQAYIDADAEAGASVFRQCSACHMVGPNAMNRVGPPLNGIVGREWGSIEGFRYSDSHVESGEAQGGVWTVAILSEYLDNPRAMVPRTRMSFGGLRQPGQTENVIKYLAGFDAEGNEVDPAEVLAAHYDAEAHAASMEAMPAE
ncbi:MAG: cytochrome c family protein [Devosiaceae bacterium]